MSDSDATVLENLKLARDAVLAAMTDASGVQEYEIRGRRVRRADLPAELKAIEELIRYYDNRINASRGPARVLARPNRR